MNTHTQFFYSRGEGFVKIYREGENKKTWKSFFIDYGSENVYALFFRSLSEFFSFDEKP